MKNKFFMVLVVVALGTTLNAQQNPTGSSNSTVVPNVANSSFSWFRGGNLPGGAAGTNNIFGTFWNSPIHTYTNSQHRTRLNGSLTTTVNSVNKTFDGYFGISPLGFFNTNTPWSMLHLDGPNNTPFGGAGWRRWMNTGLFMRENSDCMYVI